MAYFWYKMLYWMTTFSRFYFSCSISLPLNLSRYVNSARSSLSPTLCSFIYSLNASSWVYRYTPFLLFKWTAWLTNFHLAHVWFAISVLLAAVTRPEWFYTRIFLPSMLEDPELNGLILVFDSLSLLPFSKEEFPRALGEQPRRKELPVRVITEKRGTQGWGP